jgi:multidrug transporter EmrE-like cation transporter
MRSTRVDNKAGYLYMLVTVALTTYGNLVFKWRVDGAGELPATLSAKFTWLFRLLASPWILTSFLAACGAAAAYLLALQQLELSRAYPVMSLSFVLVLLFSAFLFSEAITASKVIGIALILAGLWIGSQTWG